MVTRLLDGLILGIVLLLLAGSSLAQNATSPASPPLSAFVDRTDISINDIITLTIRTDASLGNTRPSLDGLNRSFEQVGGSSTRSTYTNNGGNIQSWNEFSISLRPRTTGTLTIPAFRVGSQVTNSITINVGEASAAPTDGGDEIFMQSSISKEEAYVQEQLIYTIKIYYSIGFDQGAQLTSPQVGESVVQQLGSDENYQEVVNGIGYNVTERRFVIYPQGSGELTIPPVYFTASVGRRSGINRFLPNNRSQMREINLTSDTHMITVLPRPASFPANATWLPAADLQLEESWSGPLENVPVGEAVTRNIVLTTTGLSSSLLPGIEYAVQPGLKFYPDQPVREDVANRDGVVGKRSEGTAIVASDPGIYQLPEVRVPWWNTTTNSLETATLPARTISVPEPAGDLVESDVDFVPIAGTDTPPAPVQVAIGATTGANVLWIGSTIGFACLWLFSTMMWLRSRRDGTYAAQVLPQAQALKPGKKTRDDIVKSPDADVCLRVLQTACANNNLHDVRTALLKWGQASFESATPMTLEQLSQRCGDARLTTALQELDSALYGTAGTQFNNKELYEQVAALHKRGVDVDSGDRFALPPLYKA